MDAFVQFRRLQWHQDSLFGLTPSEVKVLFCIKSAAPDGAGVKVSELSNLLHVAAPTATQQANSLERAGFVQRSGDPDDRRVVRITLTDKGEEATRLAWQAFSAAFAGLVKHLGEEDSEKLADLLTRAFAYFQGIRETNT